MIDKAKTIMKKLYDTTKKWTAETDYSFSVYSTPAESLGNRFESSDKNEFGVIENITDREFYTNSFHVHVEQACNAFEKIDYESNFVQYSPGGFTSFVDANSLKQNLEAIEKLWDYSYEHTNIGYLLINVKEDQCFNCGFTGVIEPTENGYCCPNCGNKDNHSMYVIRRVSGYLTSTTQRQINKGKKQEMDLRYVHF